MKGSGEAFGVFVADQVKAATKDSENLITKIAKHDPYMHDETKVVSGTPWVNERMTRAIESKNVCSHLKNPCPIIITGWGIPMLRCRRCWIDQAEITRGTNEDLRCDVCRKIFPTGLFAYMLQQGIFTLQGACCESCKPLISPGWSKEGWQKA